MSNIIPMEEMVQIIKEQFESGGEKVSFTPRGYSMLPMLRDNEDKVILVKAGNKLKKYDLPLYQRDNGKFVLHRVVKVEEDGTYSMCGDNQVIIEKGIRHDQIIGIVSDFERKGKWYTCSGMNYNIYCCVRVATISMRRLYRRGVGKVKKALRKIRRLLGRVKRKLIK